MSRSRLSLEEQVLKLLTKGEKSTASILTATGMPFGSSARVLAGLVASGQIERREVIGRKGKTAHMYRKPLTRKPPRPKAPPKIVVPLPRVASIFELGAALTRAHLDDKTRLGAMA